MEAAATTATTTTTTTPTTRRMPINSFLCCPFHEIAILVSTILKRIITFRIPIVL
jgi:hypothetical protein